MTPKNIIFDLDGTLTDSGPGIINCAKATMQHFGIPIPDDRAMRTMVGPPLRSSFARFGIPTEQVDDAIAYYRGLYVETGMYENIPYPGITELLEKLKSQGHALYVATSKPEHMAKTILDHFALSSYFDRICGSCMDGLRDKKADVIAYLLEQIDSSRKAVMIGDTVFDVLGASQHHIPTLGVAWGYGSCQDMIEAGAVAIAENMDQLYDLLRE